jgi:hypothetical protein
MIWKWNNTALKMRWQLITQAATGGLCAVGCGLPQLGHFAQQLVNLLLLARNDVIQLLNQVFRVSGLDFKIGQTLVCGVGMCHGAWYRQLRYKFRAFSHRIY